MLVMTFIPLIGLAIYSLVGMLSGISVEKDLTEIKVAIKEVHELGDMVHYLEVKQRLKLFIYIRPLEAFTCF